ncbi:MAG TPA: serine/threonine-protein kinase [Bryobacteraceae bacterium]|nr:serine/threonine-protein kinase [Bryobacteraceae bacterium]
MGFIGKYQTLEILGSGSMACVYRAEDHLLDREVALKVLHPNLDVQLKERFYREARVATRLRHPNIALVWDLNESEGATYIAMELLRGEDLRRYIERRRVVPLALKVELMAQVCDGLAAAHRKGIIHGDIRPSHIFIHEERTAKLLDFGMAQWPAQQSDARRDVLSVGAVLYEFAGTEATASGRFEKVLSAAVEGEIGTAENVAAALRDVLQGLSGDLNGSRKFFRVPAATPLGGPLTPLYGVLRARQVRADVVIAFKQAGRALRSAGYYLENSLYRFCGMLFYGVAQKKAAKYWRARVTEIRTAMGRTATGPHAGGQSHLRLVSSWAALQLKSRTTRSGQAPRGARIPWLDRERPALYAQAAPAVSQPAIRRVTWGVALASFLLLLVIGIMAVRAARKPAPAEQAVATAAVEAALADLHETRSGAGKVLATLTKGTRVNLLERQPLGQPAFIRVQVASPHGNSRPGYLAMRDLGQWASNDPSVAWDLIRSIRPTGDPTGNVGEAHQRQFLSELEDFATRFNGTPQAEQARLQEITMLLAFVDLSQKAGKPRFEWHADLDRAHGMLAVAEASSVNAGAFAHLRYRLDALEERVTPPAPGPSKLEIALAVREQDQSLREPDQSTPERRPGSDRAAVAVIAKANAAAPRPGNFIAPALPSALPSPAPPKPDAARQGLLSIVCQPVDCDVWTNRTSNRKYIGSTIHGELSATLPEGPVKISATKADYEPDREEETVAIGPDHPARVEFHLAVSRVSLDLEGRTLFRRMIQALGEQSGLRDAAAVLGSGFIEVYRRDGQPSRWPAPEILIRPAGQSRFAIRKAGQTYEFTGAADGKRLPQDPEFAELAEELPLVTEYQLGRVVERLDGNGLNITATGLEARNGEAGEFRARGGAENYVVTLDSGYRPKEIRIESAGLHSGFRILFSAYESRGRTSYPKMTQVLLPGAPRRGVFVSFEKLELNPRADPETFATKKKGGFPFLKSLIRLHPTESRP